jgi:hypothetical protein
MGLDLLCDSLIDFEVLIMLLLSGLLPNQLLHHLWDVDVHLRCHLHSLSIFLNLLHELIRLFNEHCAFILLA